MRKLKLSLQKTSPMMLITLCVISGIVVSVYWNDLAQSVIFWVLVAMCIGLALWRDIAKRQSFAIIALMLVVCGVMMDKVQHKTQESLPSYDTTLTWSVKALSQPKIRGKYVQLTAIATAIKDHRTVWQPSNIKIELNIDSSLRITPHKSNRIALKGKLRKVEGGYGEWLARQGIVGKVYSYHARIIDSTSGQIDFSDRVAEIRGKMALRVEAIDTTNKGATATMCALTLGERTMMPGELKAEYRRSGAAHLLAISGLHVGIIVTMANFLFGFVRLWRYGRFVFGCAMIILMWAYALFTGMSPSVVRAVTMFSLYQIGVMSSRSTDGLSVLSTAALLLLIADTRYLFDIGFQLSFIAMLGITTLYRPFYGLLSPKNGLLRMIWGLTTVALTAQVAVAPLIAYYFGQIPLLGIVINPLIWITVPTIIAGTALFLMSGWSWIGDMSILAANLQNYIIGRVAAPEWATIQGVKFGIGWLVIIYSAMIVLVIAINIAHKQNLRKTILVGKYNLQS